MDFTEHHKNWLRARDYADPVRFALARGVLEEVRAGTSLNVALRRHSKPEGGLLSKDYLVHAYRQLVDSGEWQPEASLLRRIRMKPVRTLSGVTTVTVLTKPYPCPGKCIFCPTDVRMPKSYLHDEPGAMRAEQHAFDPYDQTLARIQALEHVGHPTVKIELLILGGTWSSYRRDYQAWFVERCLDAMNRRDSASLAEAQMWNENAPHRNVGLCVETRPDHIDPEEIAWLRSLGVTRIQIGVQSLDDRILEVNRRGHDVQCTRDALRLLRAAGFKLLVHWMPNLLGATPESDFADGLRLWSDPDIRPDELKIYPCSLLANAELYEYWLRGEYQPYADDELLELLVALKPHIPSYTRVNRVVRDIPATNVVAGSKRSNLREDVQSELSRRGLECRCIRCREVRGQQVDPDTLRLEDLSYPAGGAEEHFLQFLSPGGKLAGYLRLSMPGRASRESRALTEVLPDLAGAALVREVHVYGQSLQLDDDQAGAAQHIGLGTRLLREAERIAKASAFRRMAIIASLGTRGYYQARGYRLGETYMIKDLNDAA